jgi:RNA polymerase sigma-70 factor (ECF subfamily)
VLWPLLRRWSARALPNVADAEDAAQNALTKVFEQTANFDRARDGVAWVLTIAAFECRTARRKMQRRREGGLEMARECATDETPERLVVNRDLEAAVRDVLETLAEEDVQTIMAAIDGERPVADATFRKRLQRALGRLRLAWRAKHEPE